MKAITNKLIIILAFVLLSVINVCSAAPNLWKGSFVQGFVEYGIVNEKGDSVIIACNIGASTDYENGVHLTLANQQSFGADTNNTYMEFVIEDESYPIPDETMTRSGSNAWDSFIEAISKATVFDVYVDNKKVATFNPNANNVKKVLKGMECSSLVNRIE